MTYPLRPIRTCRRPHAKNYSPVQLTFVLLLFAILSQAILLGWHSSAERAFVPANVDLGRSGNVKPSPPPDSGAGLVNEENRARAIEQYGNLPLSFERARDQKNEAETFLSRQGGFMVSVNSTGAVFAMARPSPSGSGLGTPHRADRERASLSPTSQYDILRMDLVSANNHSRVVARKELPGRVNYFIGANPNEWKRDIPTYSAIRYSEVYPGIDLEYYGNHRQLEYDFIVAPGADPRAIRMSYEGVSRIVVEEDGTLVLENPTGQLRQQRPLAYQTMGLVRQEVPARYVIKKPDQVSIEIGSYDSSKPLVIDPVFVYSTYLGGGLDDIGYAVTMDSAGNAYVAGRTLSTNFPTVNPFRSTNSGLRDIFVTKLNSSGTSLVYSTYIGGSGDDLAFGIVTNSSSEAYLTGWTSSGNFPLANALQPFYGGGGSDAFLVRLNANGNALISSTYAGGNGDDIGRKIALDSARNIYGIGYTTSTDLETLNAIQPFNAGGFDAFLIELTPTADAAIFSTYAGGSGTDLGLGLAVDSGGSIYAIGDTDSTNLLTVNALQPFNAGGFDAFLAKLTPSGSGIVFATYAGGNGDDSGQSISLDGLANIYATGYTNSTNLQFIVNAVQPVKGTGYDAFLAKLNSSGTSVIYGTFLGGNNTDAGYAVAADTAGNVYVTGETSSTNFPIVNPLRSSNAGVRDVFVTKLNPTGSTILFSTYLGGSADDIGYAIAADDAGVAYVTGRTASTNFSTSSPLQPSLSGGLDAFVSKINTTAAGPTPTPTVTPTPTPTVTPTPTPTPLPSPTPGDIVISQIYGGGGTAGATYQNSYIEVFNRGSATVNLDNWLYQLGTSTGTFFALSDFSNMLIQPGQHRLIQLSSNGSSGAALPVTPDMTLPGPPFPQILIPLTGKIAITKPGTSLLSGICPLPNSNIVDFVGFGITTNCFEGSGPAPDLSNTTAAIRLADGCTDTNNNASDFSVGAPSPRNGSSPFTPCPIQMAVQFSASTASTTETPNATTAVDLVVTRTGDTSAAFTVDYASSDGTASERSDYLAALGTLHFAPGEISQTITVYIVDDAFGEGPETFNLTLSNPTGAVLGAPTTTTITINSDESVNGPNPVRDASFNSDFFVRQHYVDFFNRAPDIGGLNFWKNQIDECTTQACRDIRKINVSAAFFLAIEFQQTGYLVERLYKSAYGNGTGTSTLGGSHQLSVPIVRLNEFLPDTQQIGRGVIIGQPGWDQVLENNKQTLIAEFVQRSRFTAAYPSFMTPAQFVDTLNANAGGALSQSERDQLVSDLTLGAKTRAQVLRAVAEDADLFNGEKNQAFVLAQFFGYLRRDPNASPDSDYTGYDFWLGKLNQFNGNFVNAEMVKAFIVSGEYQQRFGP